MDNFYYVYILTSKQDKSIHYTGLTQDINKRLKAHNNGQVPHTSKNRPWEIETLVAFNSHEKALAFEKYLKSHSGLPVAKKRMIISPTLLDCFLALFFIRSGLVF